MSNHTNRQATVYAALLLICLTLGTSTSAVPQAADEAVPPIMRHHFEAAGGLHSAIVRGDLAGVREAASRLATIGRPPGLPASADVFVSAIVRAARRSADGRALSDASAGMVRILDECGGCHRASAVRIAWPNASTITGAGLARHMRTYGAGLSALLEGLMAPSYARWRQGADTLADAAIGPNDWPDNPLLRDRAASASSKIRRLAEEARRARSPSDRSRAYASLIETCGDCHQHYPGLWGPRSQ